MCVCCGCSCVDTEGLLFGDSGSDPLKKPDALDDTGRLVHLLLTCAQADGGGVRGYLDVEADV